MSATPLIEPILPGPTAAVVSAPPAIEAVTPMPLASQTNPFGVPLPVQPESHHEQTQQEDYLWGV
jgi:hypothetical protein